MRWVVCSEPGCGELHQGSGRCPDCRRSHEKTRGTRQQRGYGATHTALRAKAAAQVAQGGVRCARCGQPIRPGEPWDLGHNDDDRTRWTGPEHAACNRATAGRGG